MPRKKSRKDAVEAEIADGEPTNELEALDATTGPPEPADTVTDANVLAVRRVDVEIRRLMDSWVDLERQLGARDAEISSLQERAASAEEEAAAADEELAAVRRDCERLRVDLDGQRQQAEEARLRTVAQASQVERLQSELGAARQNVTRLAAELECSRTGRADVERQLAVHRDALLGMGAELRKYAHSSDGHDSERAALTRQVAEGTERCEQLSRQLRSAEAATRQGQHDLAEAGRRLTALEGRLRAEGERASGLEQQLHDRAAVIEAMRREAGIARRERAGLEDKLRESARNAADARREAQAEVALRAEALQRQIATGERQAAELRNSIDARDRAIGQLEAALERQRQRAEKAQNMTSRTEQLLEESRARLGELAAVEARATRLAESLAAAEAAVMAAANERGQLLARIEERQDAAGQLRTRVGELETELTALLSQIDEQRRQEAAVDSEFRAKRKAIAALGAEIDRLGLIQENVRKLDGMITRQLSGVVAAEPTDAQGSAAQEEARNGRLLVCLDGGRAMKYPLYKPEMVIGRSKETDIRITGRHMSRRHARVVVAGDSVLIEDLGSLNGIIVNDAPVERATLRNGDIVDIGGARLRFVDLDEQDGGVTDEARRQA